MDENQIHLRIEPTSSLFQLFIRPAERNNEFCNRACVFIRSTYVPNLNKQHIETLYSYEIDEFRYIKIQPKTIDLSARLMGINPTNSVVIPKSLVVRSIVLG